MIRNQFSTALLLDPLIAAQKNADKGFILESVLSLLNFATHHCFAHEQVQCLQDDFAMQLSELHQSSVQVVHLNQQ